jgi:hypothetical protein
MKPIRLSEKPAMNYQIVNSIHEKNPNYCSIKTITKHPFSLQTTLQYMHNAKLDQIIILSRSLRLAEFKQNLSFLLSALMYI